jgi:hypothetical protein
MAPSSPKPTSVQRSRTLLMKRRALVAARAPGGGSHSGEGAVDFGKAVQATARVTFLAADKKIEACLVVRVLNVQRGDQHGSIEETISLGLPGIPAIALLADITERFCGFIGGHAPAGAEDPDALLLLQR